MCNPALPLMYLFAVCQARTVDSSQVSQGCFLVHVFLCLCSRADGFFKCSVRSMLTCPSMKLDARMSAVVSSRCKLLSRRCEMRCN